MGPESESVARLASGAAVRAALAVLDEFCEAVSQYTQGKVRCQRERGFVTNLGQEWRVVIQAASGGPAQVMFRAHVPVQGFPVLLDLHEEALIDCQDEAALRAQLEQFLQDENVRAQIAYFSE